MGGGRFKLRSWTPVDYTDRAPKKVHVDIALGAFIKMAFPTWGTRAGRGGSCNCMQVPGPAAHHGGRHSPFRSPCSSPGWACRTCMYRYKPQHKTESRVVVGPSASRPMCACLLSTTVEISDYVCVASASFTPRPHLWEMELTVKIVWGTYWTRTVDSTKNFTISHMWICRFSGEAPVLFLYFFLLSLSFSLAVFSTQSPSRIVEAHYPRQILSHPVAAYLTGWVLRRRSLPPSRTLRLFV